MYYKQVDVKDFMEAVANIKYRADDLKEAKQFGCTSVLNCFEKANHLLAKYFIVYEDNRPIVTVMLQRDGHIIFFISKDVKKKIKLIRLLRRLANHVVKRCGGIITKTATWYEEAQRLNKLIGFKPYKVYDFYGYYVKV